MANPGIGRLILTMGPTKNPIRLSVSKSLLLSENSERLSPPFTPIRSVWLCAAAVVMPNMATATIIIANLFIVVFVYVNDAKIGIFFHTSKDTISVTDEILLKKCKIPLYI